MNIKPTPSNIIKYHQQKYDSYEDVTLQLAKATIDYLDEKYELEKVKQEYPEFNTMPWDWKMNQDEGYKQWYKSAIVKEKQEWVD